MNPRRLTINIAVSILMLQGIVSCVHRQADGPEPVQEASALSQIGVTDLDDRLQIEVDRGSALTYSMSTSMAPPQVIVDLPGLSLGEGMRRVKVDQPPIIEIIPSEVSQPRAGIQLAIKLTDPVKPSVRTNGSRLFIDFPKEGGGSKIAKKPGSPQSNDKPAAARASGTVTSVPPANPSDLVLPARTMEKVEVHRAAGEATVVIVGDGAFEYDITPLDRSRLVIDLLNVTSPLKRQVLPVGHPLLKRIRIGHHPRKLRLVFDLSQPSRYSAQRHTNQLAIRLTASTGRSNGNKLSARAAGSKANGHKTSKPRQYVKKNPRSYAASRKVSYPEKLVRLAPKPGLAQLAPDTKAFGGASSIGGKRGYSGRRISLDFQGADISNVFRLIAEVSGFNIVVGEGVKNKVTIKMVNVPWDQALDMLLKMNGLGMIREGNIVWIDKLTNIARQQEQEAKAKESSEKAEEIITEIIYVRNVAADEIQTTLAKHLGSRGQLDVDRGGNALVVQDTASRVKAFKELVEVLDIEVPQVQIEARIIQADTNYSRSLGVQWGVQSLNTLSNGNVANFRGQGSGLVTDPFGAQTSQFLVNLPAAVSGLSAVPALGFTFGSVAGNLLDLRISAGELLGLTKVIAAPKVTTLDKREAKIEQGESIPFQTTSLQGTQTTFVDANLTLQVTPQITSRDPNEEGRSILLKVKATRNAVGARSNPAGPSIDKREATTQVLVRDGDTMVIGGIFVDTQTNTVAGMPYLSRIPVLGWLFKSKTESVAKQELLIFLTPTIVKT